MEYLLVTGFALLMITPIFIIYGLEKNSINQQVTSTQVQNIARKMADAAETVYYLGTPATTTLKIYMPERVQDVTISGNSIDFRINTQGGLSNVSAETHVNLTGTMTPPTPLPPLELLNGKVDGNTLSFQAKITPLNIDATLIVEGDNLEGEAKMGFMGKSTISGVRA